MIFMSSKGFSVFLWTLAEREGGGEREGEREGGGGREGERGREGEGGERDRK